MERLEEAYNKEKNSLVRLRIALMLTKGKYTKFNELKPDYNFCPNCLNEILDIPKAVDAYEKILRVNREHEIVIEESVRILSLNIVFKSNSSKCCIETLCQYIFNFGVNHKSERIRRISLWSIYKTELLNSNDTSKKKYKRDAINAIKTLEEDSRSSVKDLAIHIMHSQNYRHLFLNDS